MILRMEAISSAGPWIYPLLAVLAGLLGSIVRAAVVIRSSEPVPPAGPPHHAVVVWGVLGLVVGLIGTVVGFGRLALGARTAAGGDRPELEAVLGVLFEGALVIVTPVTLGLWLLTASLVAWLVLGLLLNRARGG